jgi:uncharacterized protein (TIGR01244 family)
MVALRVSLRGWNWQTERRATGRGCAEEDEQMTRFIELAPGFLVAPQISEADVAEAARVGVALIINNRPDREEPGQPAGAAIEKAARAAGIAYVAIPVTGMASISADDIAAFAAAVEAAEGPTLAFCRSGTRSTVLRALAEAARGAEINRLINEAADAGYNLSSLRGALEAQQS